MRYLILGALLGGAVSGHLSAEGQTHKVAKQGQVVRAVGIYEWTGDMAKPTASRLIPVSVFIEGKYEDAGVYLERPIPFALLPGNVYELQQAGIGKGSLDLVYAKHLEAIDDKSGATEFDDGWFGYGSYMAPTPPRKKQTALKASKTLPVIQTGADPDKPHFSNKSSDSSGSGSSNSDADRPTMKRNSPTGSGSGSSAGSSQSGTASVTPAGDPADDPDRPTMKRRNSDTSTNGSDNGAASSTGSSAGTGSGSGSSAGTSSASTGSTSADDPDRPTMKRSSSGTTADSSSGNGSSGSPADDPDRPTLKRRTPEEAQKAKQSATNVDSVTGMGSSLNDDPDRPSLHHGKPANAMTESDLPKLTGVPSNLHQMVAVSDAENREAHDFSRPWDSPEEQADILKKMQAMAQAKLATYGAAKKDAAAAAKPAPKTVAVSKTRKPPTPAEVPLLDESVKGYTLSYGGDATYVYMAHTDGTGASLRYVTVVAQMDGLGNLKPAIQSVTDAAHLDRSPQLKFVDVVDVEASNRASLLFELRGQNSRQFGIYRLIAGQADQTFLTGSTQ
jgi:hypothetical protein